MPVSAMARGGNCVSASKSGDCATSVLGLWRVGGVRCFDLEDAEASLFLAAGVAALAARLLPLPLLPPAAAAGVPALAARPLPPPLPPPAVVTKEGIKKGNTWSKYRVAAGG